MKVVSILIVNRVGKATVLSFVGGVWFIFQVDFYEVTFRTARVLMKEGNRKRLKQKNTVVVVFTYSQNDPPLV